MQKFSLILIEPFISGVAQLSWDVLNHGAGFYPIFYNPNPISKPNAFDIPLPIPKPNRFHNRKGMPKPSLNLRIHFFEVPLARGGGGGC